MDVFVTRPSFLNHAISSTYGSLNVMDVLVSPRANLYLAMIPCRPMMRLDSVSEGDRVSPMVSSIEIDCWKGMSAVKQCCVSGTRDRRSNICTQGLSRFEGADIYLRVPESLDPR